ncbi:hypothetical protein BJ912DRAFT_999569 [Pholiota molesta]|nr:hypothetical protein BJ912DRAFT_999569 [Pholiota molesta]
MYNGRRNDPCVDNMQSDIPTLLLDFHHIGYQAAVLSGLSSTAASYINPTGIQKLVMFRILGSLWLMVIGLVIFQTSEAARIDGLRGKMIIVGRGLLESRQTGTGTLPTPPQCVTNCTSIANELSVGCTVATCCTAGFMNGFFSCFICAGQAENLTDYTMIQQTLDSFNEECASEGVSSLPKLTFPGQNPNRPLSSVPSSGAATPPATLAPGLPISTGLPGNATGQSTVTAISTTPLSPQNTISSASTSTPAPPSTTTSSGARTMPMRYATLVLISSTVLTGLSFYLVL